MQLDQIREHAHKLLHEMKRIRLFEEKCAELYSVTKIRGFLHLYIGEEAVAVGIMQALKDTDSIVATYREHGHAIARGISMKPIMAEMYGKQEGCSRGRGGSMHLFDAKFSFFGGNAIVAGGLPLAVGLALSYKMYGNNKICACFFGDGAVAEGEFHEALNLAALWKLPVLFCCENNRYGMGTALELSESETDIHRKAESYKIKSEIVDGMNIMAVEETANRAVSYIREGNGPYFLELQTYRFRGHSMFDTELYRKKNEVESWKIKDPIEVFTNNLFDKSMLTEEELSQMEKDIEKEVSEAVNFAENGTWEPVENLTLDVYTERAIS